MSGIVVKLVDNQMILVEGFANGEEFMDYLNRSKQFVYLSIIEYSYSENYYRDDDGFKGLAKQIVLNKNLIKDFDFY